MQTKLRVIALAAAASLTLVGCSTASDGTLGAVQSQDQSGQSAGVATHAPIDVSACLLSDADSDAVGTTVQMAQAGMERGLQEVGVATAFAVLESSANPQAAQSGAQSDATGQDGLSELLQQQCDLIIGLGPDSHRAIGEAAGDNPDVTFALLQGIRDAELPEGDLDNVVHVTFDPGATSYLAGYASAALTPSGLIATILSQDNELLRVAGESFQQGIERYNENHGKQIQNIGWRGVGLPNVADDATSDEMRICARTLIREDAGLLFPLVTSGGSGALKAAEESGKVWTVWFGTDGVLTQPDYADLIFTSVVLDYEAAVLATIEDYVSGTLKSDPYVGDLKNEGVKLAPWRDYEAVITDELADELQTLEDQLADGSLNPTAPLS